MKKHKFFGGKMNMTYDVRNRPFFISANFSFFAFAPNTKTFGRGCAS